MRLVEYTLIAIVALLLALVVAVRFVDGVVTHFVEPVYMSVTHKPLYVHFYASLLKLSPSEGFFLTQNPFYRRLSPKHRAYFEHRVAKFILTYRFHGKDGLQVTDEMRVKVAGVYVMLTFGMRHYLVDNLKDIVLYPDAYQSQITGKMHKGEFNPAYKVVVFSWKHFDEGLAHNDNMNLGIHEFAHVFHLHSRKRHNNSSANFAIRFNKVLREVNHAPNRHRLEASGYFRHYAYANQHEFLAVVLEHFFETPGEFRRMFPELYQSIGRMINQHP